MYTATKQRLSKVSTPCLVLFIYLKLQNVEIAAKLNCVQAQGTQRYTPDTDFNVTEKDWSLLTKMTFDIQRFSAAALCRNTFIPLLTQGFHWLDFCF